ncbi:MAG TPA: DUF5668 domain-containing protein [Lentimicrobium sp.]|jgi:predicted membrane protein|nr:DUF5668 domain-containing protein [Lentimicrobium sp.]
MENQDVNKHYYQSGKATVLGLLLILFGGLYFMHQAGLIDPNVWHVIFSWQMLLIALGLLGLAERNYAWGTTLIVIGGLFLYRRVTGTAIDYFWPVIIIIAGLAILFVKPRHWSRGEWAKDRYKQGTVKGDFLNETAIFGGNERIVRSENFKGGVVVSIFGGSKIDLTQCTLSNDGPVLIEMTSIFGGSNLILPSDWNVKVEVTSILGGFSDKRFNANIDMSKVVIIKGVCIFGGGEVK